MPESNWRIGFTIGLVLGGGVALVTLVWIIGLNYCPDSPCEYHQSQAQDPAYYEPWLPFSAGPNTTSGFEPEDTKGNSHYYERQDLRAQESVARATNALVWLTLITGVIGFSGAGLLVWTLIETRANNKITRDVGEATVRAYVTWPSLATPLRR